MAFVILLAARREKVGHRIPYRSVLQIAQESRRSGCGFMAVFRVTDLVGRSGIAERSGYPRLVLVTCGIRVLCLMNGRGLSRSIAM